MLERLSSFFILIMAGLLSSQVSANTLAHWPSQRLKHRNSQQYTFIRRTQPGPVPPTRMEAIAKASHPYYLSRRLPDSAQTHKSLPRIKASPNLAVQSGNI